jgi:hypothetical protein
MTQDPHVGNIIMENDKRQSRKNFIGIGIAAAVFTAFRFLVPEKRNKIKTAKMLTQDGKLVEVDVERLSVKRRKITDEQLKKWVNKKI